MKKDERVLVVPGAELDRLGRFQGFSPDAERYLAALLVPEFMDYRPRSQVEDDPGYKQIIPYVVFRSGDAVFCYKRGQSQGESRLHRLRSLGVGGHVSEEDAQGGRTLDAYESALRRELDEEVAIGSPGRIRRVGLINDDATPGRPRPPGRRPPLRARATRRRAARGGARRRRLPARRDRPVAPIGVRDLVADLHRLTAGDSAETCSDADAAARWSSGSPRDGPAGADPASR